jgi:hypothetical protein
MSYKEWLANNPPALDMSPAEQKEYRQKIVAGCVGIDDCWIWSGARTLTGYGNIWVDYTTRIVSRLALCLDTGVSLSMTADACHIPECPSRACCNPRHLFWGTHQKNCSMRESRDARWERYINAMAAAAATDNGIFVVFEKRYKMGWGWLDCRSVQSTALTLSHSYAKPIEDAAALLPIA